MISPARLTTRNLLIAVHDVLATAAAVVLSFYLPFGEESFWERWSLLAPILPFFLLFSVGVCYFFDLTVTKWRFVSTPDILNIVRAASVLAGALLIMDYIFVSPNVYGTFFVGKKTIIIYWLLEVAFLSGSRLTYRYYRYSRTRNRTRASNAATALIAGVAADAETIIRAIESGAVRQIWPVGILSPSRADQGQRLRGLPVLGHLQDLSLVIEDLRKRGTPIQHVVMTPSAFAAENNPEALIRDARQSGIKVSRLPFLDDSREPPRLMPVAVEDLLLRPTVKIDYQRLEDLVRGRAVAVTGGGGSIGSEICRRLLAFGVGRLMILEHAEPALYAVQESLKSIDPNARITGHIADIRDRNRIFSVMESFRPDIVFHAAALKHVPILEQDFREGVKTNIFGTINVADATRAAGAEAMVMISTDKAIEPVSMLGLTKRFAELYCQALDSDAAGADPGGRSTRFISVRFGNVLASNGSVVPKFKSQIEAGGPVTVTHPDMVRYFMTIREACDLVITAASHALASTSRNVSVYVLKMGQPVKIAELADRLIRLSGLVPGADIDVVFTGIRPGERLHEILFSSAEPPTEIGIDGVMAAKPHELPMPTVKRLVQSLNDSKEGADQACIRAILCEAIPEFQGRPAAAE